MSVIKDDKEKKTTNKKWYGVVIEGKFMYDSHLLLPVYFNSIT